MSIARAFVHALYDRLRHRCFVSGTFVVAVPHVHPKAEALLRDLRAGSTRRLIARTHADFRTTEALRARRLCAEACADPGAARATSPQMEFRLDPPLTGLCGEATAEPKRAALWYTFEVGRRRYLFLKLESSPALSLSHATAAAARYLLKREKKGAPHLPKRRENAYKDAGGVDPGAALLESAANARELWPEAAAEAAWYDRTARIGRELFVPASVLAAIMRK